MARGVRPAASATRPIKWRANAGMSSRRSATDGTAKLISDAGLPVKRANKVREGRPHIVDMIKNDEFAMIVNTTEGKTAIRESNSIRREAVHKRITYYTTLAGALATCEALDHLDAVEVNRLQDLHKEAKA